MLPRSSRRIIRSRWLQAHAFSTFTPSVFSQFWQTAPAFGGRAEVWQALKAVCDSDDRELGRAILSSAGIRLVNGVCVCVCGWVVSEHFSRPQNRDASTRIALNPPSLPFPSCIVSLKARWRWHMTTSEIATTCHPFAARFQTMCSVRGLLFRSSVPPLAFNATDGF
jgi:hypothetical protein